MGKLKNFFSKQDQNKLETGLAKTKNSFLSRLGKVVVGKTKIDEDFLDELESILIQADVGVATTLKIIDALEDRTKKEKYLGYNDLIKMLGEEISSLLTQKEIYEKVSENDNHHPHVVMVVGVNGVGKTTTIGKLAHQFKTQGKKIMLGAADTFRAGAIDQLQIWADRAKVPLVRQEMGSDPASVAFDTLKAATNSDIDLVFIDTAGRLHNKINLMNELSKVKRVMSKVVSGAPHEVLLVLDGSTGQNAFEQAKQFTSATEVTSLAITKLDGTAKGGVLLGISDQFQIPVRYIGVGEGIEDLQDFNPQQFIQALFS
ncbi:MAG: signal recognition particle-docking protein FtsY [Flavobacteriaceae bacterium TMED147]|nr:MAG: signal recognition particle-docking protein FtsY [Flavobacteriaceae bacterium TMED147]|tara:strand:+ start:57 stop:1004 length:948 start_codon:yes stop_codon:yes gene_type:complete